MAHIVWDWNGTLLDDLRLIVDAANAALGRFGADPIGVEAYRAHFTRPIIEFYSWALDRAVTATEEQIIDDVFFDHYHEGLTSVGLNPQAQAAVEMAAGSGATQSILSMWWHDRLVPAVDRLGLASSMVLVDGLRGTAGESKVEHLVHHLGALDSAIPGLDPGDVVLIGDVVDDAAAASVSGTRCVLFAGGTQSRPVLERTGMPVVGSLCDAVELALTPAI